MTKFKIQKNKFQLAEANRVRLLFGLGPFKAKNYTNDFWIKILAAELLIAFGFNILIGKKKHFTMQYSLKYNHML